MLQRPMSLSLSTQHTLGKRMPPWRVTVVALVVSGVFFVVSAALLSAVMLAVGWPEKAPWGGCASA